jgi:hypothetical protein
MGGIFNTRIQLQEMQDFVAAHPDLGSGTRAFQGAMESIRSNIKWMDNNYQLIRAWLERQGYGL